VRPGERAGPAGYSGTPLPQKLGIKAGHVVFLDGQPAGVDLGDLPPATVVRRLPRSMDVCVTWHLTLASLERRLPVLFERTTTAGMVWVCWPKQASKVPTDLTDNVVRAVGLGLGFVDVKVAAIDATWSGEKFVRRLRDR
jgi:hypothetical protein